MVFWKTLWSVRNEEALRKKVSEMATEFCLEASVLISVLGILDSALSSKGWPSTRVFALSLCVGGLFFAVGCIIQAYKVSGEQDGLEEGKGEPHGLGDS